MITFSILRLSPDMASLKLKCEGTESEQISAIYLEYYKNYSSEGPSTKAYEVPNVTTSGVNTTIQDSDISVTGTTSFIDGLFYVYVQYYESGNSTALHTATAVVLDWGKVYVEAMSAIKQLATECGNCSDNQELIDFILRWEALKLAIETCDWDTVHCMWDQLFMMNAADGKPCGCA